MAASAHPATTLDKALEQYRSAEDAGHPPLFTPSLDALNGDQDTWRQQWVEEGYADRQALLHALNQLQFLSLGRIPDGWYFEVARRPVILSVVITSENRLEWRDEPVSLSKAHDERARLHSKYVRPAFRAAYRELAAEVKQYTNEGERVTGNDLDEQPFALRPVMVELYAKQTDRLAGWLDGFDTTSEIDHWLQRFDDACRGQMHHIKADWDWEVRSNPVMERVLTSDEPAYERERELLAARYLLPALNRAVRYQAHRADEHRERPRGEFDTKGLG